MKWRTAVVKWEILNIILRFASHQTCEHLKDIPRMFNVTISNDFYHLLIRHQNSSSNLILVLNAVFYDTFRTSESIFIKFCLNLDHGKHLDTPLSLLEHSLKYCHPKRL